MRNGMIKCALAGILALLWTAAAAAQQVRFIPDFSSIANLQTNFSYQATYNGQSVLRLTPGATPARGVLVNSSSTWFKVQQSVNSGFTTYFRFQIHNPATCCDPGDGLAFVVQNASSTDETYGTDDKGGKYARGVGNGGLGYTGIPNSLAVEFDTTANVWDPTIGGNNHVAIQGCGTNTNSPVHVGGTYTIGHNNNVTSCLVNSGLNNCLGPNNCGSLPPVPHLGVTCSGSTCADGVPHDVVIEYAPVATAWTLMVYVDPPFIPNTHTPCPSINIAIGCPKAAAAAINIPYNIDGTLNSATGISLAPDPKNNNNKTLAYVGFTASQATQAQQEDILAWEFTPHTPAQVQQTIPPGGTENHFSFGSHDTVVNYYPGYQNNGCPGFSSEGPCLMTVVATPTPRSQFYINRLKGTPFAYEQCIVYQGTGGNCVVYSITCQTTLHPTVNVACPASLPNTCNYIGDPTCINFSTSYYTSDSLSPQIADYLKTDPIGTNNWQSIFLSFQPNVFDPKTTGTGSTPSDFVATFAAGAKP